MIIKRVLSQYRRDMQVVYVCDHEDCDHAENGYAYDDTYFHVNVVPNKPCPKCKRTAKTDYEPRPTKYHDSEIV